ncbi:MAG: 50S ribosomal protein L24 [Flavobacteriales bacterium]|nr:MAG: 50S ribosomal protein L24 [Flavobacteriales bacterium]
MKTRFKPKFNIKKGDQVAVIAGDDKSRTTPRQVLAVYPLKGRVLVEGVNIVTKHVKPSAKNPQGGIVKEEASIAISNIMLWDAKAAAPVRVNRELKEGKTVRISKKTSQAI